MSQNKATMYEIKYTTPDGTPMGSAKNANMKALNSLFIMTMIELAPFMDHVSQADRDLREDQMLENLPDHWIALQNDGTVEVNGIIAVLTP